MRRSLACMMFLIPTLVLAADTPVMVKVGTLSAKAPENWKSEKPANLLRSFQFKIPSGEEGLADAEVIVMPASSAKQEKEFPRWSSQFTPPDGKKMEDVTKESKLEIAGATAHVLDIQGTWKFKERPFDPKSKEVSKPEYRAIWIIVVQKDEATHVRFSGPQKLVEKQKKSFDEWLKALK